MNTVGHYENFPVASILVKRSIREEIVRLYRFARAADDIADEGYATPEERAARLQAWRDAVDTVANGQPCSIPEVQALAPLLTRKRISVEHLHNLLSAFSQDTHTTRYLSYDQLLEYCSRSANPVGRLVLEILDIHAPTARTASDAICSALQLINFWQDVAVDLNKGRIYLPQEDLEHYRVEESALERGQLSPAWRQMMRFQIQRTRQLMMQGRQLLPYLRGRMKLEIALTMAGGLTILDRIEAVHYDVFRHRPVLSWRSTLSLVRYTISLLLRLKSP